MNYYNIEANDEFRHCPVPSSTPSADLKVMFPQEKIPKLFDHESLEPHLTSISTTSRSQFADFTGVRPTNPESRVPIFKVKLQNSNILYATGSLLRGQLILAPRIDMPVVNIYVELVYEESITYRNWAADDTFSRKTPIAKCIIPEAALPADGIVVGGFTYVFDFEIMVPNLPALGPTMGSLNGLERIVYRIVGGVEKKVPGQKLTQVLGCYENIKVLPSRLRVIHPDLGPVTTQDFLKQGSWYSGSQRNKKKLEINLTLHEMSDIVLDSQVSNQVAFLLYSPDNINYRITSINIKLGIYTISRYHGKTNKKEKLLLQQIPEEQQREFQIPIELSPDDQDIVPTFKAGILSRHYSVIVEAKIAGLSRKEKIVTVEGPVMITANDSVPPYEAAI